LCEYWNERKERWLLVDSEINDLVRKEYKTKESFNPFDINHSEFISSGRAWQMCKAGEIKPEKIGVPSINITGFWFVIGSIVRDLASLNKIELLPWDYTDFSDKQFKNFSELPREDLELLDKASEILEGAHDAWKKVIEFYAKNSKLQIPERIKAYTSTGPIEIKLS